jgi:hypothetical protein
MWHAWEKGGTCTRIWWESPKDKGHLKDQSFDGSLGLERILERLAAGVWIGFTWLRIWTVGGLL